MPPTLFFLVIAGAAGAVALYIKAVLPHTDYDRGGWKS